MAYIWDLWTSLTHAPDRIQVDKSKLQQLGECIAQAMETLPPAFCGPVRDPFLKRQSQYKIYKWMALLHWYLIPICLELKFDHFLIDNFAQFVWIIDYAMTITTRTENNLHILSSKIASFLEEFERLYVAENPKNISRCRLCIFQLIHIPSHIKWNGSVRLGSQATVERSIGELTHRIRSRKAPFANLSRLLKEKELIKLLILSYPQLKLKLPNMCRVHNTTIQMSSRQPLTPLEKSPGSLPHISLKAQLEVVSKWLNYTISEYERWGKIRLANGYMLESRLVDKQGSLKRNYRWFKASDNDNIIFGEALAFFRIQIQGEMREVVVYQQLLGVETVLKVATRGKWGSEIEVLDVSRITTIVGIWNVPITNLSNQRRVYILQRHPGLDMLMEHLPEEAEAEIEKEVDLEDIEAEF